MRKSEETRADVAVVGGGVAGLSAAREVARRGVAVVVVEGAEAGAEVAGAGRGRRCARDWQVESRRLVGAPAASVTACGARLWTKAAANGVRVAAGRAEGVETSRGFLSAGAVVLAAGAHTSHVPLLFPGREGRGAR